MVPWTRTAARRRGRSRSAIHSETTPGESELFGYEKSAFTDAHQRRKGRFELAEGGTLFLDEIGDINLQTQVKLLRVLQAREFERLGGTETIKSNVPPDRRHQQIDLVVNTTAGCAWTASSQVGWITVRNGASGTGAGHVHIAVAANVETSSRAGTILVGGQTATVNGAGFVGQDVTITGVIADLSGACPARQFTVSGRTVTTTAATNYPGKKDCGDLRAGRSARVEGRTQPNGSVLATKIDRVEKGLTSSSLGEFVR